MSIKQLLARFLRTTRINLLSLLGYTVLRLLFLSLRWDKNSLAEYRRWLIEDKPRIAAFWHSHQLMMGFLFAACNRDRTIKRVVVLISRSSDGRIIAQIMRLLGLASVAGSSSRGGAVALKRLLAEIKSGSGVAITPDGPLGPALVVKAGIVRLARESGYPVYPKAYGAERLWRFNSWDGMFLPKPFSRAVVKVGNPIYVPADVKDNEIEEYRLKIESELNQVAKLVEKYEYT